MANSQAPEATAAAPQDIRPDSELTAYRDWLIKADYEASEAYDKTVMTLSGGALAISITFLHDIAPNPAQSTIYQLELAWISFGVSIAAILISKLTSHWALRKAINQVDSGSIYRQRPGRGFSTLTSLLNVLAGAAFLLGVILLAWFAVTNIGLPQRQAPASAEHWLRGLAK